MMKKGRHSSQAALNRALDDLLGDDSDDAKSPTKATSSPSHSRIKKEREIPGIKRGGLSSSANDDDFYSNLAKISGDEIVEDDDKEEGIPVTAEDANQIAKGLADMDDLESDLFSSSFNRKKTPSKDAGSKKAGTTNKQSKKTDFDFDEDDPLAGLGLSDDESDAVNKSKPKKQSKLSRKGSQGSLKKKIDPENSPAAEAETSRPRAGASLDKEDPFLASDPRPRSGSGDRSRLRRLNSWDDHSQGTASEAEVTPRSQSPPGGKGRGKKTSGRGRVNPTPAGNGSESPNIKPRERAVCHQVIPGNDQNASPTNQKTAGSKLDRTGSDISFGDSPDLPDFGDEDRSPASKETKVASKQQETNQTSGRGRKQSKIKPDDDMFGDDDGLPGLDEDSGPSAPKKVQQRKEPLEEPTRKATSALDDLLGGRSKAAEQKTKKPTFLDQMLAKSDNKPKTKDNESPVTSPREKEFQFGGYSPSIGGSTPTDGRGRPTTAPNRRAVRFADELGLDDNDFLSSSDNRPRSAPNNPRSRPGATKRLNKSFSFDEDESNNSAANKNEKAKPLVNKPVERVKSPEAQETKEPPRASSKAGGDWLGLGDDTKDSFGLDEGGELFLSRIRQKKQEQSQANQRKNSTEEPPRASKGADWLGLGGDVSEESGFKDRSAVKQSDAQKNTVKDEKEAFVSSIKTCTQAHTPDNKPR